MESLKFSFGACGATATYIKTFLPRLRRVDEIAKIFRRRLRRAEKIAKNFRRRLWSVEEIAKNFPSAPAARRGNRLNFLFCRAQMESPKFSFGAAAYIKIFLPRLRRSSRKKEK